MMHTVRSLFRFHSGSGDLVEKAIYEHQPQDSDRGVAVYSSATDDATSLPRCAVSLVEAVGAPLFGDDDQVILVARNGQAGTMRLLTGSVFTISDHAYAMTLKKGADTIVDPLFFTIAYQNAFFDLVTSKDGNGTFTKSVAESLPVFLPDLGLQRRIAADWTRQAGIMAKFLNGCSKSMERLRTLAISAAEAAAAS